MPDLLQIPLSRRTTLALLSGALVTTGGARAETSSIQRGGTLTALIELDAASLDPLRGNAPATDRKVFNLFAESLLLQDVDATIKPWLAESWTVEDGGRSVLFSLRKDVLFQDGTPFDATAAKFNLDRLLDKTSPPPARQFVQEMQGTDVVDDHTIRVRMSQPAGAFLAMMAAEAGTMISPAALKARGVDFARSPVGTGPFSITGRTSDQIVGERNPHYWRVAADGRPMPYLDRIELNVNPNEAIRLIQLRSGAAQLSDPVTPKNFDQVRRDPDLVLLDAKLGPVFMLSYNVTKPPFDNILLRKAFAMGIDRTVLVKAVTGGQGEVLRGTLPSRDWAYDDALQPEPFDLAQSKALYAQSGHKGPITLEVVQRDPDTQVAQIIQAMLKGVGMDVHINVLERLSNLNKVLHQNYEVTLGRASILQMPDPDTIFSSTYGRVASLNYMGFKDEAIFDIVDKAHGEMDQTKRKALYTQIQQQLNDQYLQTFLIWSPTQEVASRRLQGMRRDSTLVWHYDEMWLEKA